MKGRFLPILAAATGLALILGSANAIAAGGGHSPEKQNWSFGGAFGTFDRGQLQRGFKVFKEVCSSCHGMKFVAFRNLREAGGPEFTEDEAKAIAAEYTVMDGPNGEGEMFEREAKLHDRWPSPFPNDQAAAAANNGAVPPDFSLLAKARAPERGFPWFVIDIFTAYQENGPDYIYALLTHYEDEAPEGIEIPDGLYYNPYFVGGNAIAMAPPLFDDMVEYTDGTAPTIDNYARDVTAFMMWAAEPSLEQRKKVGTAAMLYMLLLAGLLLFTKLRVWSKVDH